MCLCVSVAYSHLVGVSKRLTPILFSKPIITATCCSYSTSPYIDSTGIHTFPCIKWNDTALAFGRTDGQTNDWSSVRLLNVCSALWFDLVFWFRMFFHRKHFNSEQSKLSWLAKNEDNKQKRTVFCIPKGEVSCSNANKMLFNSYLFKQGKETVSILL